MDLRYYEGVPIKVGDIACIRDGTSIVARGIRHYMKKYKKKLNINNIPNYHHNGIIVDVWGRLNIAEAVGKGFKIHPLDEAYGSFERIDIITPNKPLTEQEQRDISKKAEFYSLRITRYDYFNFIFQIWLIKTGKWIGPKGQKAENRFYCSEAVATIYNYIRPGTFKLPAATNPIDVAINDNFHWL